MYCKYNIPIVFNYSPKTTLHHFSGEVYKDVIHFSQRRLYLRYSNSIYIAQRGNAMYKTKRPGASHPYPGELYVL